mmetsp:Transcript_89237/g.237194  ORF Transcript_89237/g.237194 Transcript_89237/m.237194 type:complete len:317 (+) Transcript_89237:2-952(+)
MHPHVRSSPFRTPPAASRHDAPALGPRAVHHRHLRGLLVPLALPEDGRVLARLHAAADLRHGIFRGRGVQDLVQQRRPHEAPLAILHTGGTMGALSEGGLAAPGHEGHQPVRLLDVLGVVRREEEERQACRIPVRIVVQVWRERVISIEARLQVPFAPSLAEILLPQLDVEHVLILGHPRLPWVRREPLVQQVGDERQSPKRPRRMSMVPSHGGLASVGREPVDVVRVARPPVPGHPMHWHDRVRVLLIAFAPCGLEERVHPGKDDLVEVNLDACEHPRADHGADLVEVERHVGHGAAEVVLRSHPVDDEVREVPP